MIRLATFTIVKDKIARTRRADNDLLEIPVRMMTTHHIRLRAPDIIDALDLKREVRTLLKSYERPRLVTVNRELQHFTYLPAHYHYLHIRHQDRIFKTGIPKSFTIVLRSY